MRNVVVTDTPRASLDRIDTLAAYGVSTVHEAMGRTGYLGPGLRPAWPGCRTGGNAVTVLCRPGDNLMIHVAVEQCREGDLLVVTTTSPSTDGMFGELFATALRHRGVRGLVINAGVRDVAELRAMGFPVWSAAVSAQGTVKATAGAVNVPIVIGGQLIRPGDTIVADDDGVLASPRANLERTITASAARAAKEAAAREAFAKGELGLDRYGLRERLPDFGITYVTAEQYTLTEDHHPPDTRRSTEDHPSASGPSSETHALSQSDHPTRTDHPGQSDHSTQTSRTNQKNLSDRTDGKNQTNHRGQEDRSIPEDHSSLRERSAQGRIETPPKDRPTPQDHPSPKERPAQGRRGSMEGRGGI